MSCDEALLDISGLVQPLQSVEGDRPSSAPALPTANEFAENLRAHILRDTNLQSSAGVANSILLARMALREAKPNGQKILGQHNAQEFLQGRPIEELPQVC